MKYSGDDELFIRDLQDETRGIIYAPYRFSEPIVLYDPSDYQWTHDTTWLWHLRKIEADRAWDIQKGDPNTRIAILDTYFDPAHPDLQSELVNDFDPIDGEIYDPNLAFWSSNWHGTTVAGFASGQTTDSGVGQPLGADYASIGYKTKIIAIKGHGPERDFLYSALYASTVLQADVISLSMFLSCHNQTPEIYEAMISEILDNGTVIVNAAGNGYCTGCYESVTGELKRLDSCYKRPIDFSKFTPTYPFHPGIDERIIIVTGVTKNDSLTRKVFDPKTNQYKISTHSYFQGVDVSAPGYDMWGLQTSKTARYDTTYVLDTVIDQIRMDIDTIIYNRPNPFWNGYGGTSFATPIVAGLAGLIKSQNPWLGAAEVQSIIKSTSNTDIVRDAGLYQNQTGRRINAFKALSEVENQVHNYEICDSTEVTWVNPVYIKDSIVICSGSTLRVKSDVFFREQARIKVKIGGQLIVDGGRLTGEPHRLWQGVLAYSNPKLSQNPGSQAKVVINNNGTIENAITGIATVQPGFDPDSSTFTHGGAIIIGNGGIFKNNRIAVSFNPYNYHNNNDFGSFVNCLFIIDSILIDGSKPECFVKLSEVNGIDFKGCIFNNLKNVYSTTGIYSYNSAFIVDEYCNGQAVPCPVSNMIRSEFKNLKYGIYMLGAATTLSARVENCIFENNSTGAYISGIIGLKFNSNQVNPAPSQTLIDTTSISGLYLDACTKYTVEDNHFSVVPSPFNIRIGIVVNNSGSDNNIIKGNLFTNLSYGIHAQGKNRSIDGLTGLEIRCNTFENCLSDISVYSLKSYQGIKKYQGDLSDNDNTSAAGNLFSNLKSNPDYWSINNWASSIDYLYHRNIFGDLNLHDPFSTYNVTKKMSFHPYDSLMSCPHTLNGGETKEELQAMLWTSELIVDSLDQNLKDLVDNGDTEELASEILYSYPDEAADLQLSLLSTSPYLSDSVMHEAIKKENVLNNVMIRDLVVANSHSAKSESIISALDNRNTPMPDELYNQIISCSDSISIKELLEAELSLNIFNRDQIFDALIKVYQTDSTEVDTIITLCSNINLLEAKYLKVLCELYQDQTAQAYTSVAEIPSQIDLGTLEVEYNDFSWLINKIALYGSIYSIPPSELNISLLHNEQVIAYIRNILIDRNELTYEEPYTFPSSLKSAKIRRTNNLDNKPAEELSFLRIYPNPAKDFVVVDYNLPNGIDKGSITLFDLTGNVKIFETLHSNTNQIILYLLNLNAGSYIIELRDDKSRVESIKLSFIK